jgi:cytoskeleton protein RodZ
MSVEDVARRLRLTAAQVHALEADDYAYFSAAVFARGFMRSYARLLNVDVDALLPPKTVTAAVALPQAQPATRLLNREPGVPFEVRRSHHVPAMLAASVLILGGLTYYEFVVNAPPGPVQMASTASTTANLPATPTATDQPSAQVIVPASEMPRALSNAENLRLKTSSDPMSGANARGLHFMFNNESWVEVRDAVGKVVYSRLNAPGSESIVQGVPPFTIVIGGASGVQLSYNGNRVDIASYMSEDVARLRLE